MSATLPATVVPPTGADLLARLRGKRVLITGGTGSFGCKMATHLMRLPIREVRIFSRDEKKQFEMRQLYPGLHYVVGDVRDADRLRAAMRGADLVFHAAALKQVPSCEDDPIEATKTNVLGSHNVFEAAIQVGVERVVALSTDKAVKPVNAMGISKALMERLACAYRPDRVATKFCCVRYGNVMGSRGSVIPQFLKWIRSDEPLRLTVPQMTRFLLSLEDSVSLVVHAMAWAEGGEVFVRKAPACTVEDLAAAMCERLSRRGSLHPVIVEGPRPGEKVHEVLVNEYEMRRAVETPMHYTIAPNWHGERSYAPGSVGEEYTSETTTRITDRRVLADMVEATLNATSLS